MTRRLEYLIEIALALAIVLSVVIQARGQLSPACVRSLTSEQCMHDMWLEGLLLDQRRAIDSDAQSHRDEREFDAWVLREYGYDRNTGNYIRRPHR